MPMMKDGRHIVGGMVVEGLALLLMVDWRSVDPMASCYCWDGLGGRSLDSMTALGSSVCLVLLCGLVCVLHSKIGRLWGLSALLHNAPDK